MRTIPRGPGDPAWVSASGGHPVPGLRKTPYKAIKTDGEMDAQHSDFGNEIVKYYFGSHS